MTTAISILIGIGAGLTVALWKDENKPWFDLFKANLMKWYLDAILATIVSIVISYGVLYIVSAVLSTLLIILAIVAFFSAVILFLRYLPNLF